MKKNVGELDSFLRITGGLAMLGIGIVKESNLLIGLGAMKVAEGVTKYCPVLDLLDKSTTDKDITLKFSKDFSNEFEEDELIDS